MKKRYPLKEIKRPRAKFDGIKLKNDGTYGLKVVPQELPGYSSSLKPQDFFVDRWTPVDEMGKNKVSEYKQITAGWLQVKDYPLWYGFEPIGESSATRLGEYFDVVIIRPKNIGLKEALSLVSREVR